MLNFYRAVSSLSISLLINTLVSARLGRGFQNEASAPANTTGVTWIYPSRSTSTAFNTVDTLVAQWTSSYQEPILTLWCREDVGGALKQKWSSAVPASGSHSLSLNYTFDSVFLCHLQLSDPTDPEDGSNSPVFSISNVADTTPQTWIAALTSSATKTTSTTDSLATATASVRNTNTQTEAASASATNTSPPKQAGSNTTEGVGIGIGVAVGAVLLILGGIVLFLRRRRRRESNPQTQAPETGGDRSKPVMVQNKPIRVLPVAGLHETSGSEPIRYELDASSPVERRPTERPLPPLPSEARGSTSSTSSVSPVGSTPPSGFVSPIDRNDSDGSTTWQWPPEKQHRQLDAGPLRSR